MERNDTHIQPGAFIQKRLRVSIQSIEKPEIVGIYSINCTNDGLDRIRYDSSYCKYLKKSMINQSNLKLDLSMHYQQRSDVQRKENPDSEYGIIENMLKFILANISSLSILSETNGTKLLSADVIAHREILTKLMVAHCDPHMKWSFIASKFKGNIYICALKLTKHHAKQIKPDLAHYLFADAPGKDLNTNTPGANKLITVLKTKLHETTLMYSSIVEGIDSDFEIDKLPNWDNLKLVRVRIVHDGQRSEHKFTRFLSPHWWAMSMLLGNCDIQVGFHDDKNIFDRTETHTIESLLKYEKCWPKSGNEMLSFVNNILEFVKLRLRFESCPYTAYKFDFLSQNILDGMNSPF